MSNLYERFKEYAVEADSLTDFLSRYTNPRRAPFGVLDPDRVKSYQNDLKKYGFCFIPSSTTKSGEHCAYYGAV